MWSDNFSKRCRFASMAQLLRHVLESGVRGDVAECGCWKGTSTYMIASLLERHGFAAHVHVFDSFEGGLSDLRPEDMRRDRRMSPEEVTRQKAQFESREDDVARVLGRFPFVRLYKGWIPDRFGEVADTTYRFVHIDVDLYQPTLDSLRFFYPRVENGGAIAFDDYGFTAFPGAKQAIDEYLRENTPAVFYRVPTGGAFLIK